MAMTTDVAGGRTFPRLHWGAVIAGVLLALAAHVVLGLIGAAAGFAGPPRTRGMEAAAGLWGLGTPFLATLAGAWLACRLAAADDARAAGLHGLLVWCIGLIAGAMFLTGTMATGAMTAGTAAGGNATAAQRQLRAEPGQPSGPQVRARSDLVAARAAAVTAGGGALAAIAGLIGGICGAALASRERGRLGRVFRAGRGEARREAGDRGRAAGYGTEMPSARGAGTSLGESELPPPTDPYHH